MCSLENHPSFIHACMLLISWTWGEQNSREPRFCAPTVSLAKVDSGTVTKCNFAGDSDAGASWTDKIMANKADGVGAQTGGEGEGAAEDEWVRMFTRAGAESTCTHHKFPCGWFDEPSHNAAPPSQERSTWPPLVQPVIVALLGMLFSNNIDNRNLRRRHPEPLNVKCWQWQSPTWFGSHFDIVRPRQQQKQVTWHVVEMLTVFVALCPPHFMTSCHCRVDFFFIYISQQFHPIV